MSRHTARATSSCASFVSISPSHARSGARSLACLLSRTRGHGVRWRWRWRWRRSMARVLTCVMAHARDRHNCARAASLRASFIISIYSPPRKLVAELVARLSLLSHARSRRVVGWRWRRRRWHRRLMMTVAVMRAHEWRHYTRRAQRRRVRDWFRSLPLACARRRSLVCSLSRMRGCGACGDGGGGGGGGDDDG